MRSTINSEPEKGYRVLMSAYACEPQKGSEPSVGWNMARGMARFHEVWVITRANNRPAIEAELASSPVPGLHFVYYDLPRWARWWKRGGRGVQLYYYLWQACIYPLVLQLHREIRFDLVHHVTFGKYWAPCFLTGMPVPAVWGPLGGGESAPRTFLSSYGARGVLYEVSRNVARRIGELDPFVRATARQSSVALVATTDTFARLRSLGSGRIAFLPGQTGLNAAEIETLGVLPPPDTDKIVFISIGRLLHWKGYHLALQAFQRAGLEGAEYWLIGTGPEKSRLEALARRLGIAHQVKFRDNLPREETLRQLASGHVFLHPSLHDFSPTVCIEAMGAGKPVICLDLGGPAMQVTPETGIKVPADHPEQAIQAMSEAMQRLASDVPLRLQMGEAGRRRVSESFSWEHKVRVVAGIYDSIVVNGTAYRLETARSEAIW